MPKITRASGPTCADPATGEPVRGPEQLQVIPTESETAGEPEVDEGAPPAPAGQQFDPTEHNVNDVQAYLADCDDPAERERVLNAEAAGKNRSTIMTGRAAGMLTSPDENSE